MTLERKKVTMDETCQIVNGGSHYPQGEDPY